MEHNQKLPLKILSKWVNTDLVDDRRFLLKYAREKFYHRCVCVQEICEKQM